MEKYRRTILPPLPSTFITPCSIFDIPLLAANNAQRLKCVMRAKRL
jgi:hypothetical protein